jgi:hypothetical protein
VGTRALVLCDPLYHPPPASLNNAWHRSGEVRDRSRHPAGAGLVADHVRGGKRKYAIFPRAPSTSFRGNFPHSAEGTGAPRLPSTTATILCTA